MNEDWSTSSYSGYNGDCVQARFRKSSHSANGNCTEVRMADGAVQVRDSKDPDGGMLTFTRAEWESFTAGIRRHMLPAWHELGLPAARGSLRLAGRGPGHPRG